MNSLIQWINGWIHGYNELTGEFMDTMNKMVNALVQSINWWIHGYNEITGEFLGTMN